jgi:hypothetical protein
MKINKISNHQPSDWTQNIVEASTKKQASIQVEAGKVSCPLANAKISSMNCEICKHCKGSDFKTASSAEYISCSYGYEQKQEKVDSMSKFVSAKSSERIDKNTNESSEGEVTVDDFKSFFAKSKQLDNFAEEEIISKNQIISSKDGEVETDCSANFMPRNANSIFNPEVIAQLEESERESESKRVEARKQSDEELADKKASWNTHASEKLAEIGYVPTGTVKNTESTIEDTKFSNPDVGEYKFSVFDNIDEKVGLIPEKTEGEKLKEASDDRRDGISRDKKEDEWQSVKEQKTTSSVTENFLERILNTPDTTEESAEEVEKPASVMDSFMETVLKDK